MNTQAGADNLDTNNAIKPPEDDTVPTLVEVSVSPPEELHDDDVCIAIRDDDTPDMVLKAVLLGLAEEQSSLRLLREKRSKEDKDTSFISLKRGTILKYMSETLLQRQALMGTVGEIDLRGPKFREVFKMLLSIISETFDEIKAPHEYKEMFFHALSKNLDGWEERAERIIKAMTPKMK